MTRFFRFANIVLALVIAIHLSTPAQAAGQEGLALKGNVKISADVVKIGDLFDNSGSFADVAIFSSPAPGKSGRLNIARIVTAIRTHGLVWDNPLNKQSIVVTRTGSAVPMKAIKALIAGRIAKILGDDKAAENFEITLDRNASTLVVPIGQPLDAEILHLSFDRQSGRFSVVVAAPADKKNVWHKTYRGHSVEIARVPVPSHQIKRGETISRRDIEIIKVPRTRLNATTLRDPSKIVGLAAKRTLRIGKPLRARDLEAPTLVSKNSGVFVSYTSGNLRLSTRARSLSDGALGEAITVINPKSHRKFQATVTGYGRAKVVSAPAQIAALTN